MRIELDKNETAALVSALDNYLNGIGMSDIDEDEPVIENIISKLS
jgi:hypothetical protein